VASGGGRAYTDEPKPLNVRVEIGRGPYYVGQGIDLAVAVAAGDFRPTLELPRPQQADLWVVDTSFQPLSATTIGPVASGANVFVTRLRLVARRAGTLELPPMVARGDGRTGRGPAARLTIEPAPLDGRPASFLGGVGSFAVRAGASPASVAFGQEILYRIEITGPAAWGTTARPELERVGRLAIAPQVEPLEGEEVREPPSRAFLWRLRPTRPGEAVLSPVSISAYDPASRRYVTKASQGVPIKVVAVPAFDPGGLQYTAPAASLRRTTAAWAALLLAALGGAIGLLVLTRRRGSPPRAGRSAARKFARDAAARWDGAGMQGTEGELARRALEDLVEFARIAVGRPAGALTPDEAGSAVRQATGRAELGDLAASLCERCDRILFSQRPAEGAEALRAAARDLFQALSATTGRTSD
jgi:hypothetical protein